MATRQTLIKRAYVSRYLAEHPCVDCGNDNPIVLEFDHVRGAKSESINRFITTNRSLESLIQEIDKCDVRCANCHRIKTANDFGSYRLFSPELLDGYVDIANKAGLAKRKLDFETAQKVRLEYKLYGLGYKKLAKKYGVSREMIRSIVKGKCYKP